MSVNDEHMHPWLVTEKEFTRQCIAAGKVVIGICLGSQLIASALGCRVYRNEEKEIGWFPIRKNRQVQSAIFDSLPSEIHVFHWHGETFDLPEGAELIASSAACRNQVFTVGSKVIGMQCHLETTPESLTLLVDHCRVELQSGTWIQQEKEIIAFSKIFTPQMHRQLFNILDIVLRS